MSPPNPRPRRRTTSRAEGTPERAKYLVPSELDSATTPDLDGSPETNGSRSTDPPDPKADEGRIEATAFEVVPPGTS